MISAATNSPYDHAGICVNAQEAVDATAREPAIAKLHITSFFDGAAGMVRRHDSQAKAILAAQHALALTDMHTVKFSLLAPPVYNQTTKTMSPLGQSINCSQLVWRAFKDGANVELVDLQAIATRTMTVEQMARVVREFGTNYDGRSQADVEGLVRRLLPRYIGLISPHDLACSQNLSDVVNIEANS